MEDDLVARPKASLWREAVRWFSGPPSTGFLERWVRRAFILLTLIALACLPTAVLASLFGFASAPILAAHVVAGGSACALCFAYLTTRMWKTQGGIENKATVIMVLTLPHFIVLALRVVGGLLAGMADK